MSCKRVYTSPDVDVWHLSMACRVLESLSLEGNVDEIVEGEDLGSSTGW